MTRLSRMHFFTGLFVVIFLSLVTARLLAVTCSGPVPDIQGRIYGWPSNVTISVNASSFPASLQSCVQTAFDEWSTANAGNGSNVNFGTVTFGSPIDPTGKTNVYQVTYDTVPDPNSGVTGGQIAYAEVYKENTLWKPKKKYQDWS